MCLHLLPTHSLYVLIGDYAGICYWYIYLPSADICTFNLCVHWNGQHFWVMFSVLWILQDHRESSGTAGPIIKIEIHKAWCSSPRVSVNGRSLQGQPPTPISACLTHVGYSQRLPVNLHPHPEARSSILLCLAAHPYPFLAQVRMPTEPCLSVPCLTHSQAMVM